ncbi:DUF6712 family protein [Mucilaginibacter kameinonensis]|uniref:DUF6712 family protein n=1 Tax=Mucilaginibacter kameinonensis TaxID=452286 RepID=UPI000EF81392|nr:hypothetical protein [Mucilaginibacter kameinonensis]
MRQITFISVDYLKENSIIQANVEEKILSQAILEFQELELEELIGSTVYKRLSNEVVSATTISGYTIPDVDSDLLRYIKPFMLYGSLLNSLNPLHYKVSNKGVQKLNDDNATTADKSDIDALRSTYTTKKDAYKKRLLDYLKTDEDPDTNPAPDADSTFSFTGISLSDDTFNYEDLYRASVYKTGYYRRRVF